MKVANLVTKFCGGFIILPLHGKAKRLFKLFFFVSCGRFAFRYLRGGFQRNLLSKDRVAIRASKAPGFSENGEFKSTDRTTYQHIIFFSGSRFTVSLRQLSHYLIHLSFKFFREEFLSKAQGTWVKESVFACTLLTERQLRDLPVDNLRE